VKFEAEEISNLVKIHSAVLLFGVAGLFGKLLDISSINIVAGRTFFASLALLPILYTSQTNLALLRKSDYAVLPSRGILLALHWITFFKSIQVSSVAIGLLTYATFPVFVAFLEPILIKTRWQLTDLLLAVVVFGGLVLIIPDYDPGKRVELGVIYGTLSGLLFALLTIFNRKYVQRYSALKVATWQNIGAFLVLAPLTCQALPRITPVQVGYLLLLGTVCTALAHTLFIGGMRTIKARTASIVAALEPVYGIVAAYFLLGEVPVTRTLIGGGIIVGCAVFITFRTYRGSRQVAIGDHSAGI